MFESKVSQQPTPVPPISRTTPESKAAWDIIKKVHGKGPGRLAGVGPQSPLMGMRGKAALGTDGKAGPSADQQLPGAHGVSGGPHGMAGNSPLLRLRGPSVRVKVKAPEVVE